MNDLYIYANDKSRGGTITVIEMLSQIYNIRLIKISDIKSLNENSLVIAVQPKSIFILFFVSFFKKINDYYIFDTHPRALSFIKKSAYILISVLLILRKNNKGLVPNGPMSNIWPFKLFRIVDWSIFIKSKFKLDSQSTYNGFVYIGTCTPEKGFTKFIDFYKVNSKHKFNVLGYATNNAIREIKEHYAGEYNEGMKLENNLLLWTSSIEAFGLTFREYVKSGGKVVFLREPDEFDRVKDAIYVYGDEYKDLANVLYAISKIASQENILYGRDLNFNEEVI
jgi:hypothetical protein